VVSRLRDFNATGVRRKLVANSFDTNGSRCLACPLSFRETRDPRPVARHVRQRDRRRRVVAVARLAPLCFVSSNEGCNSRNVFREGTRFAAAWCPDPSIVQEVLAQLTGTRAVSDR